jgi:hypothetical protein
MLMAVRRTGRTRAASATSSRWAHSVLSYTLRLPKRRTWNRRTSNSLPQ